MKFNQYKLGLWLAATIVVAQPQPFSLTAQVTRDADDQQLFIGDNIAIAQTEYGKVKGYVINIWGTKRSGWLMVVGGLVKSVDCA